MKSWQHFKTITHHRFVVMAGCFRIGLYWQGLTHDLSKYSPIEFMVGAKYYQGDHSPNDEERRQKGFSSAWLHHKGRNRHHFEYWTDYNIKTRCVEPVKMPLKFVIEMFCDRVAASKIYNGDKYKDSDSLEYYNRIRGKKRMHENTENILRELLEMLSEQGEEKTFAYIRELLRKEKSRKTK